jgi:hypothetical protein
VTTDEQRAANASNAQKSTGPRTAEGKARSSRNALQHGAFALHADAISASILREDPDEIRYLVEAIVDELDPQTPLEQVAAQTVANRILGRMRVERLDVPLTEGVALDPEDRYDLDSDRLHYRVAVQFSAALDVIERDADLRVEWGWLFSILRVIGWDIGWFDLDQTWPDGTTRPPQTKAECHVRFHGLIDTCFDSVEDAREFVDCKMLWHREGAVIEQRVEGSLQAQQILEHYERTTQLNDRVDRSVTRALDSYRDLIADRPTDDDADTDSPRNEPNPLA